VQRVVAGTLFAVFLWSIDRSRGDGRLAGDCEKLHAERGRCSCLAFGARIEEKIPHSLGLSGNQRSLDWQGLLDA